MTPKIHFFTFFNSYEGGHFDPLKRKLRETLLLFIIYLSAIETLICPREMSLIGFTPFGFAQNMIHDFQNTVLNS